jgi:predicted PurR-regulated permease PerM
VTVAKGRPRVGPVPAPEKVAPAAPSVSAPAALPLERKLRPAQIAIVGLFVIALLGVVWWAKPVLMPVIGAMVLATLLKPIVSRLEALHVPCAVGSFGVVAALTAGILVAMDLLIDPLTELLDTMPAMESLLYRLLRAAQQSFGQPVGAWLEHRVTEIASQQGGAASAGVFTAVLSSWVTVGTILLLTFFLLAAGDHFLQSLVQMLPRVRDKVNAVRIVRTVQNEVSHYFLTVTAINAALGIVIGLVCHYLDVPNALLWGTMVALLNYLPYVGPLVAFVVLSAVSAAHFSMFAEAMSLPAAYAVVTILEGHLVTPMLVGRRVSLNPVVVFAGLLFWEWLWGVAGMVLAIPLLLVAKIWAQHTPALAPWAEFLGPNGRAHDPAPPAEHAAQIRSVDTGTDSRAN